MIQNKWYRRMMPVFVLVMLSLATLACLGGGDDATEEPTEEVTEEPTEEATEEPTEEVMDPDSMDWSLEANFGSIDLETGFTPDPYNVDIVSGGGLYAGDSVDACAGYVTANPDLQFNWVGDDVELSFFFVPNDGTSDTTLIVNDWNAEWHCNDDTFGLNPGVTIEGAMSGWYSIWVGSYDSEQLVEGVLYVSEVGATPDDAGTSGGGDVASGEEVAQWGIEAYASTEYGSDSWSAMSATGAPDTTACGDYGTAWASETSSGEDWIEVYFETPVIPSQVNIYETYNPGAIVGVTVINTDQTEDFDNPIYEAAAEVVDTCPSMLTIDVTNIDYPIIGISIYVDQTNHSGWNEIDAVELIGTTP